eukprot:350918-Chlamydomonas_euryale.AAC.1
MEGLGVRTLSTGQVWTGATHCGQSDCGRPSLMPARLPHCGPLLQCGRPSLMRARLPHCGPLLQCGRPSLMRARLPHCEGVDQGASCPTVVCHCCTHKRTEYPPPPPPPFEGGRPGLSVDLRVGALGPHGLQPRVRQQRVRAGHHGAPAACVASVKAQRATPRR